MLNPYDILMEKLNTIELKIDESKGASIPPAEIIDGAEMCSRLQISEPTLITWRRKNQIPFIKIDGVIRYSWHRVVETLESKGNKKAGGHRLVK